MYTSPIRDDSTLFSSAPCEIRSHSSSAALLAGGGVIALRVASRSTLARAAVLALLGCNQSINDF